MWIVLLIIIVVPKRQVCTVKQSVVEIISNWGTFAKAQQYHRKPITIAFS